jgi:hypothetical protein
MNGRLNKNETLLTVSTNINTSTRFKESFSCDDDLSDLLL